MVTTTTTTFDDDGRGLLRKRTGREICGGRASASSSETEAWVRRERMYGVL